MDPERTEGAGDPGWQPVDTPASPPGQGSEDEGIEDGLAPEDRRPGFHFMDVFMGLDMLFITLILAAGLFEFVLALGGQEPTPLGTDADEVRLNLWINNAAVAVVFGIIPFLWIMATRVRPVAGTVRYFALERPLPRVALGVGIGILTLIGAVLVGLLATVLGVEPENLAADAFEQAMTWPLVVGISLSAAFAEEVFFRGILQKYLRWWGQAIVFAVPHIYEGVFAVFLILGVGLLFGWVVRKGGGLWTVIAAHFCFNFVQLAAIMVTR